MANEVGPARGKPTTMLAHCGRCQRLAPLCADSIMARSPKVLQRRGRRYVCSPSFSSSSIDAETDNNNGSL